MGKASEALKIEEDPYISSPDKCLGMNNRLGVYPQREELFGDDALISIKCPHCHNAFSNQKIRMWFGTDSDGAWAVSGTICPTRECQRLVLYLEKGDAGLIMQDGQYAQIFKPFKSGARLIRPEFVLPSIPIGTPPKIAQDYREASMVLALSPTASAALSRRCLQSIIREVSAKDIKNFKQGNLKGEINQVTKSKTILNANLIEMLHGVRIIGNFAAHPNKSKHTNLIMPVEPNEAEFNLTVIDKLLFYYFVQSPQEKKILDDINKKQQEKS